MGRPFFVDGPLSPGFSVAAPATDPVALRARMRRCRLPTVLSCRRWSTKGARVRAIGLDVHRDFCEIAIAEAGEVRSAGRIATRPEVLEVFAQSLARGRSGGVGGHRQRVGDRADHRAARRARGRGLTERHRHPSGAGEDRPPGRADAGQVVGRGVVGQRVDAGRAHAGDAAAAGAPVAVGRGAHAREERDPRDLDPPAEGPPGRE